jgi:NAD(P)-dependent dehydrogenase (short-subunit alcohol dehydrogenase family)
MKTRPVVVVAGAAAMGSIGHATALQAARDGNDVVVADIERPADWIADVEREAGWLGLDSVVGEIEALGVRALALHCDVTRPAQVEAMVAEAARFGRIHGLVNTTRAPIRKAVPILDEDDAYWDLSLDVNVKGALFCARAAARSMLAHGTAGAIVNVSSVAGLNPVHGRAAYCVSKAALHMLTRSLAQDLAAAGIRVNAVLPGVVSTHRVDPEEREQAAANGIPLAEQRRRVLQAQSQLLPMRRPGRPEEIASTIAFLLSAASSYVTGELISVAGGAFAPYGSLAPVAAAQAAMAR